MARHGRGGALLLTLLLSLLPPSSPARCCFLSAPPSLRAAARTSLPRAPPALRPGGVRGLVGKVRPEILDAAALNIIEEFLTSNLPAEPILKKTLQKFGDKLTNSQRARLSRRVLGVSALRNRLAFLVDYVESMEIEKKMPDYMPFPEVYQQLMHMTLVAEREVREDAKDLLAAYMIHEEREKEAVIGFLSEARVKMLTDIDPDAELWKPMAEEDCADAIAASCSLPTWLVDLWRDQLCNPSRSHGGLPLSEVRKLAESCNKIAPVTLRINRLKLGGRMALLQALAQEEEEAVLCKISPWGVELSKGRPESGIWNLAAWKAGLFEVQDEGSQLVALATEVVPGEDVLDYCAGNGGKTLALAMMIRNEGRVFAHDIDESRLRQLEGSTRRAGCTCVQVNPPAALAANKALWYDNVTESGGVDVVLVDAPCSSTGVLRRHPSLRWTLKEEDVAALPAIQKEILANASRHVRPGGGLVYATCAINRLENEDVAEWFQAQYSDFENWPFENYGSNKRALLPHIHGTDGFFVARWRRRKAGKDKKPVHGTKTLDGTTTVAREGKGQDIAKVNRDIRDLEREAQRLGRVPESNVPPYELSEDGGSEIIDVKADELEGIVKRFPDSPYTKKKQSWDL